MGRMGRRTLGLSTGLKLKRKSCGHHKQLTQLKDDLATAEQDGKRLDWLEQDNLAGLSILFDSYLFIETKLTLREAIDAAIKKGQGV